MTRLAASDIDVFPLCLGGNVFGWTAAEPASFEVLDAYHEAGGNFIDTADAYSAFAPGNEGGESETIIGNWIAARGNRDRMVVATKVAKWSTRPGLSATNVRAAIDDSLRRLQSDYVDIYYAHEDDQNTPLEEWLGVFDELVKAGRVRAIALSNFTAARIEEVLAVCERDGLARPIALQPHYSLVERIEYEGELRDVCERSGLACLPYWALARGFLTGKYRRGASVDSPRAGQASSYLEDPRADRLLPALDEISAAHDVPIASVAIAWLRMQPTVVAPIASARNAEQLREILPGATLALSSDELERLTDAWA
ncbi:MAG TPA: aldo/keto reductase [Solirubrobacteraceae bacterium]|nr:aldo/keto reductase [Solirubrobacteraceae bacterium]